MEREFKVGDHVWSAHFGKGVVARIADPEKADYPVGVHWLNEASNSIYAYEYYTMDGQFHTQYPDPEYDIILDEDEKPEFKCTDRVFYPFYGKGTVVSVCERDEPYPIRVFWDKPPYVDEPWSSFTRDDVMSISRFVGADGVKLILVKDIPKEETGESEMGQIAGVINYDIGKKMEADEEKRSAEGKKFKGGEHVWSPYFGGGTVVSTESEAGDVFPIEVKWDDGHLGAFDYFTEDGKYTEGGEKPEMGIYHIDPEAAAKSLPDILHELGEDEKDESNQIKRWFNESDKRDDSTVERMEDAINPSHYKVEGLPEAIDIMNHLMTPEQFEGFLWGNIIKYAYRYGRKGDKAETAGKIAWYADQLKAVEEWRTQNET